MIEIKSDGFVVFRIDADGIDLGHYNEVADQIAALLMGWA